MARIDLRFSQLYDLDAMVKEQTHGTVERDVSDANLSLLSIKVKTLSHLHERYHFMLTFQVWWKARVNLNHGNCHAFSILIHDGKEPMSCGMNFLPQLALLVLYPK